MARYESLGGDDEGRGDGGGGGAPSLKRNLLVVVLALALFATILGNFSCETSNVCVGPKSALSSCLTALSRALYSPTGHYRSPPTFDVH